MSNRVYRSSPSERARAAKYYWANRERVLAYSKVYRAEHPEKNRVAQREWRATNRAAKAAQTVRRRCVLTAAPGRGVTTSEWSAVLADALGRCAYCLATSNSLEIEHIDPLSKGGAHDPDNIVAACRSCNSSKGNKSLLRWLIERAG